MTKPSAGSGVQFLAVEFHNARKQSLGVRGSSLHSDLGFTLIELMIVVFIIGILAAVALPAYQDYTTRARVSEAFTLAEPAQRAINEYYARWGVFPTDNAVAGLAPPKTYQGQAVRSLRITNGVIEVQVAPSRAGTDTKSLYLRPSVNRAYPSGALAWVCNTATAPKGFDPVGVIGGNIVLQKHVPSVCRS